MIFGTSATGSRTVGSAYAELALPITPSLEASLAARWDHYSDFGSTTNPKAGLKWKVSPGVALRATYATAFRAPSLSETSQGATPGFAIVRDPMTCPVPDPANPNCIFAVQASSSGNPALKPERARSATAGIVVEPWRDASFTVDAFRIERRDQIDFIDPAFLLDNESSYPGYVVRKPDGTIDHLNLQYTNLGETRVWGIDVSGRAKATIDGVGRFGIDGSYEWLPHYWVAQTADAPSLDWAGYYEQPKSRARVALSFERGPWRSALTFHYTGGYLRAFTPSDTSCPTAPATTRSSAASSRGRPWTCSSATPRSRASSSASSSTTSATCRRPSTSADARPFHHLQLGIAQRRRQVLQADRQGIRSADRGGSDRSHSAPRRPPMAVSGGAACVGLTSSTERFQINAIARQALPAPRREPEQAEQHGRAAQDQQLARPPARRPAAQRDRRHQEARRRRDRQLTLTASYAFR